MNDDMKRVRNLNYEPYLNSEGRFWKSLPAPPDYKKEQYWFENISPNHRLFYHQTLNSARNAVAFQPFHLFPKDSLDFMLGAVYNHSLDIFNDKTEIAYQHETIRQQQRRLRNTRDLSPKRKIAIGHPLRIGGIKERHDPNNMKLMCSGHHLGPQCAAGFSGNLTNDFLRLSGLASGWMSTKLYSTDGSFSKITFSDVPFKKRSFFTGCNFSQHLRMSHITLMGASVFRDCLQACEKDTL